ncbi:nuclear transport factor 2 family protein [Amycolatopsis sp. NPDC051102]|uniref:nuclear transport factor 2 family protein n=1 Tax=Amycolatopsis sp. NPDC051102 TaxID=3155163 RepID=UPI003435DB2D
METFEVVLARWSDADANGDAEVLAPLLADDFRGDGPAGRVLGKAGWPGRVPAGAFRWTRLQVTHSVGVATGHRDGVACTVVAENRDGRWLIVNVQRGS